jgi:hypothetical protein
MQAFSLIISPFPDSIMLEGHSKSRTFIKNENITI